MKKIIVFGGSGFLGSYVVQELAKRNYAVIVADIERSPYIDDTPFEKISILDAAAIESFLSSDVDVVYNLAGFANLDKAIHHPVETFQLNVMGNLNILEGCRKAGIQRYVYASSAYAMNDKGSFYGISKLCSEKIVREYQKRFGINYTILRYGSVYSERAYENNYIYHVVKEALQNKRIIHSGDGEEIREYIHAADAARLSVDIIENDEFLNENLMLTGVERIRRVEVFQMINEMLGGNIEIKLQKDGYHHHYKTTPYSFQPEASKKLVANPYIDMGQGILECIKTIQAQNEE
ncbi:MAG: NAD(P)-dependent oxidoreductase [Flavobacteriales bacterium]|nr:NAD(P)-dependent oxidoreductase [Flavobacteriales bacterium]